MVVWCAFAIGYHSGVRDNERMWQSMVQIDPDGRLVVHALVTGRFTSVVENGIPNTAVSK